MIPIGEPLKPGWCQHCREECTDRPGSVVYPGRPELQDKVFWVCVFCGAYVGTHEDGKLIGQPLGTAANAELRKARIMTHARIDPLWERASDLYPDARAQPNQAERMKALAIIKRTARTRVYAFLAEAMGLDKDTCHITLFDIEQCRQVWRVTRGVDYQQIRDWAHQKQSAK